ncbi:hypothetical protein AKJ09_07459 [Labilithrix luteola]|uniref:Uncharacterized protein n=1 Tax=Labilithrix luteola TaxID=1391654 RepID=A0A0K1Q4P7_9BACT|nr:hypothetical protein AKJ09_07459 [Labilithrix luteola]
MPIGSISIGLRAAGAPHPAAAHASVALATKKTRGRTLDNGDTDGDIDNEVGVELVVRFWVGFWVGFWVEAHVSPRRPRVVMKL